MTPRERILCTFSRNEPDKVPWVFGFTPAIRERFEKETGSTDPADYYDFPIRDIPFKPTEVVTDFTPYLGGPLPERSRVDEWGIGWVRGSLHHFEDMVHPLAGMQRASELEEYPWPDVTAPYRHEHFAAAISNWHSRGYAVIGCPPCVGGTLFETAWRLRGLENLLVDLRINPEFASALLDKLTAFMEYSVRVLAEADADVVQLADDVGTQRGMMMAPGLWRDWFKARMSRIIRAAREIKPGIHIFYHSDGNIEDIIDDLVEIGMDILNPVQPECMDPVVIKEQYGDRLSFWGTIGTQSTMPFGSPDDVKAEIAARIKTVGRGGGLLVAPTHLIEPDVPWENIVAFVEAMEQFG